jgi:hypothetical protein
VAGPPGQGIGFAEVEAMVNWHRGYLIMSASSASLAAEVAWCEYIRLCSGDASRCHWVAGRQFVGIVGLLSWLLVHHVLLPGALRTSSRTSWISCWMWESCFVISSIAVEEVAVPGEGGGGYSDAIIEFLCQGIDGSLESCCVFPGCALGFAQCCVLCPGSVHLL